MLPFLLYLITALATANQVFTLLTWAFWGAPTSPLQCSSLIGSVLLLLSAFLVVFKYKVGIRISLVATVLIWGFYGPALALNQYHLARETIPFQPIYTAIAFLPASFLLLTTVYAFMAVLLLPKLSSAPQWLFPTQAGYKTKTAVVVLSGLAFLAVCAVPITRVALTTGEKTVSHQMRWEIVLQDYEQCPVQVILTYVEPSTDSLMFCSEESATYLQSNGQETVTVTFDGYKTEMGWFFDITQIGGWKPSEKLNYVTFTEENDPSKP